MGGWEIGHRPIISQTNTAGGYEEWDAVVIGAGPAGAVAARELARGGARGGARTLLVDRAVFPREKVCGCCLGGAALTNLDRIGLGGGGEGGGIVEELGGVELRRLRVFAGARSATIKLIRGVAVARGALDAALAREAVREGAVFRDGVSARVAPGVEGDRRLVALGDGKKTVRARVVVAADGLGGSSLQELPEFETAVETDAHMGAGTRLPADALEIEFGEVWMACGNVGGEGYVGAVRLGDGSIDVASAFDPAVVRAARGPGALAARLFHSCGLGRPASLELFLVGARWRGAPRLTRRRPVAASERVLVAGDAAGYVEPFTGEGIGWALADGVGAGEFALRAARAWSADIGEEWARGLGRARTKRGRAVRLVRRALRRPRLVSAAVGAVSVAPIFAAPVVRAVSRAAPSSRPRVSS